MAFVQRMASAGFAVIRSKCQTSGSLPAGIGVVTRTVVVCIPVSESVDTQTLALHLRIRNMSMTHDATLTNPRDALPAIG